MTILIPVRGRRGDRFMFLARVAVGEAAPGAPGVLVPDRMPGSNRRYHSTVDSLHNPRIFVTYHDAQALPEYLVTFRESAPAPRPRPSAPPSPVAPVPRPPWPRRARHMRLD